jgi:hypothetical protein
MRMIDGISYMNDGDWVESCSALVEHADGRLEILKFNVHGISKSSEAVQADKEIKAGKSEQWIPA